MCTFPRCTLWLLERSPANDQARKVSNLLELLNIKALGNLESSSTSRQYDTQTIENSRGISRAPNALPKTLRNFLACIPRTIVLHHVTRVSCRISYSTPSRTRRTFSKKAIDYYSEMHFVLPCCYIAGMISIDPIDINPFRFCQDDKLACHTHRRNFSFGRTHEIFPRTTADRYFHRVDAFPTSRVLRRDPRWN